MSVGFRADGRPHIAVLASYAPSLTSFRRAMLEEMVQNGHRVTALAPDIEPAVHERLATIGVETREVALARTALSPAADLATLLSLRRTLRALAPDILLSYTIKPVIYGSLAAAMAGVPRIHAMITGLGFAFGDGPGLKHRILRHGITGLYRRALRHNRTVLFQNPDDRDLFLRQGLLRAPEQAVVINGSGIDLEEFEPAPPVHAPRFLLIARLIVAKGVRDYAEAARILKRRHPQAVFGLVGYIDDTPGSITTNELEAWQHEGLIEHYGKLEDVRPALAKSAVYVLPSFYREGTPRTILEAMAMGRPIVTTDMPGCRETVIDGRNGFLVGPRDPQELAATLERFIEQPRLIASMGQESRRLAERKYDVRLVNRAIFEALDLVEEPAPALAA